VRRWLEFDGRQDRKDASTVMIRIQPPTMAHFLRRSMIVNIMNLFLDNVLQEMGHS
jgi:hypothetical protein